MRKTIAFAALLALSACNNTEPTRTDSTDTGLNKADAESAKVDATATGEVADNSSVLEGDAPGFEAVAPGTYQITRSGGEVDYIEIHPGMTFSRVAADGKATGGSIFMKDGKTCFLVEGQEQENCFTDGPRQPGGTMQTKAANGNVSTVRPVTGKLEDHVKAQT
ncbi:hypothetical protein KK137_00975 [Croceibacterium sp. LX-88]|uniref:Lipoprotein n=1 Tax=Croceibacterium selenioxidans TaxID=2838833 RepID=A0ABS5VZD9_9SPHN|nr:hypothetical protein [Croceibacterium selenioxidans]MBT2132893.1 hypothetical protein [Croceibacterium selenioxidans]